MNAVIESQMRELLKRLDLRGHPVRDEQYIQASKGAVESPSVVGFRREDDGGPFTGWEIVATAENTETAQFGYYSARELAALRPEWFVAMSLPPGWAFRFEGNTLVDCVTDAHQTLRLNLQVRTT